ncbi:MAG: hypothetical protein JEZ05_09345 [Tenericutes bacterium]|nr:hypothetical protein [Mycoplasmatota bacterium]
MAKKSDILLDYYNEFPEYLQDFKIRSKELERDFLRCKNDYSSYLEDIDKEFSVKENKLTAKYFQIELFHSQRNKGISNELREQLISLETQIEDHNQEVTKKYDAEDDVYQQILNQFEERKAEAFNTYLQLTKEANYKIDREMRVHHEFIGVEKEKITAKKIEYQDLNSTLSNKLLWTMEKAKNALSKLSSSLTEEGEQNKSYLDETINDSLTHLNSSKEAMMLLFKTSSLKFEEERNTITDIAKEKRKPHSEINQKMILSFIKQIRDVNDNKKAFERMIRKELETSLERLYPKIIEADALENENELQKYILQKEIMEKKVTYLLNRNQTLSDLLISKYQNEIKKIKIDSFKRFEEIQTTYSVPVAFYQNSINVYSNFAFYLNETYEDLSRMLKNFKQYNKDYIKYKTDYIHNSQKTFEDYKINLLVKVNDTTNHLTEYISKIDELSHQIVTLESNNRLEIAEIRKKMENLDVFGDYQKYIASLESDQFFAMNQHHKNQQSIQIEFTYTNNLLDINREVILLNYNKLDYNEYQQYMSEVSRHEKEIQELGHLRKIEEAKALYKQRIDQIISLRELARNQIIYNAKKTNYGYASSYSDYINQEDNKNQIGAERVIEFVHHVQNLISLHVDQTNKINEYIKTSTDSFSYLKTLEENRLHLVAQVNKTKNKKNQICQTACDIYESEIHNLQKEFHHIFTKYINLLKNDLLLLQTINPKMLDVLEHSGYKTELTSAINYIYKKSISLAYKYQIPSQVADLDKALEDNLGRFIVHNIKIFSKIKKTKSAKKIKKLLQSYYVETYTLLSEYMEFIDSSLAFILAKTTANDKAFIKNTEKKANRTRAIISKEYEKLEFYAIKHSKSQKKQLKHYKEYSNRLNTIYKKQVADINLEYLNNVKESDEIRNIIYKKFLKIVNKNNSELNKMIRFMEKMFNKEEKQLNKQYEQFKKSLSHIKSERESYHLQELAYIKGLYDNKNLEATKTIAVLESKILKLPIERENSYLTIKKEKYQLQITKTKELNNILVEIEKEKYVSRPKYLAEIDEVKKRLPEDYLSLYGAVQNLEFEFLNQFQNINTMYEDNYKEYISNQTGNNLLIEQNSPLYHAFDDLETLNTKALSKTSDTYKETFSKSQKARTQLKNKRQVSKERQDRIING